MILAVAYYEWYASIASNPTDWTLRTSAAKGIKEALQNTAHQVNFMNI